MKRLIAFISALLFILCFSCGCGKKPLTASAFREKYKISDECPKVIFDTDLEFLGDDAYCLLGLLQADKFGFIDLLGVTICGCNNFTAACTYNTLSLLEHVGREDIPVYMGEDEPLDGFLDIEEFMEESGNMPYTAAYRYMDKYPMDWEDPKGSETTPWGMPTIKPQAASAVSFITDTINNNPGEVTLLAMSAATNIATALNADYDIAGKAKRIIYMGGVFDTYGESLPAVEINWWYDPTAIDYSLYAPWKSQVAISHDAATKCLRGKDVYERYKALNTNIITQTIVDELSGLYENGKEEELLYCWDPIVLAELLAPQLITVNEQRCVFVSVSDDFTYGSVFSWFPENAPDIAEPIDVVLEVDRDAFWDFLSELYALNE